MKNKTQNENNPGARAAFPLIWIFLFFALVVLPSACGKDEPETTKKSMTADLSKLLEEGATVSEIYLWLPTDLDKASDLAADDIFDAFRKAVPSDPPDLTEKPGESAILYAFLAAEALEGKWCDYFFKACSKSEPGTIFFPIHFLVRSGKLSPASLWGMIVRLPRHDDLAVLWPLFAEQFREESDKYVFSHKLSGCRKSIFSNFYSPDPKPDGPMRPGWKPISPSYKRPKPILNDPEPTNPDWSFLKLDDVEKVLVREKEFLWKKWSFLSAIPRDIAARDELRRKMELKLASVGMEFAEQYLPRAGATTKKKAVGVIFSLRGELGDDLKPIILIKCLERKPDQSSFSRGVVVWVKIWEKRGREGYWPEYSGEIYAAILQNGWVKEFPELEPLLENCSGWKTTVIPPEKSIQGEPEREMVK